MRIFNICLVVLAFTTSMACGNKGTTRRDGGSGGGGSTTLSSLFLHFGLTSASLPEVGSTADFEYCQDVASDSSGNFYCAGHVDGSFEETNGGGYDAFVMKINSVGQIVWISHLGEETKDASPVVLNVDGSDTCDSIAVDSDGYVYCGGATSSSLSENNGGSNDAFVMKLNPSGNIVWIRQVGADTAGVSPHIDNTNQNDFCVDIVLDSTGNIFCAGGTQGNFAETNGGGFGGDAFIMKLNSAGVVQWATQIGADTAAGSPLVNDTTGYEQCSGIALDSSGYVYCAGTTLLGPLVETNAGGNDVMVMQLDPSGALEWLTHVGTTTVTNSSHVVAANSNDVANGIGVDSSGNIYVGGYTMSSFGETNAGSADVFVMHLDSSGAVQWVKQLGVETNTGSSLISANNNSDSCYGFTVTPAGDIFCSGDTASNFSETNSGGGWDPLVMKFNSAGTLQWVRQFGSVSGPATANGGGGSAYGLSVDSRGYVYMGGEYNWGDFYEPQGGGNNGDLFMIRIQPDGSL